MAMCKLYCVAAIAVLALAVILPGGQSECTEKSCRANMTCCELSGGREGCCPYKEGICCIDDIHCCPFGTVCDVDRGRCVWGYAEKKEHVQFVEVAVPDISVSNEQCPDGSFCPGVTTCCMMTTKHYGCCPYQYGVCCRDKIHCCPQGTFCSAAGTCYHSENNDVNEPEFLVSDQALITAAGCNEKVKCGSDSTCCNRRDGSASCCPMKDAVCCPELNSCCPRGFSCSPFGCIKNKP